RPPDAERALDLLDGLARIAAQERELSAPGECPAIVLLAPRRLEHLVVEALCVVRIAEPKCELGVEQPRVVGRRAVLAGGQVVLADSEAPTQFPEELRRLNPVPGFDSGDVRRRTSGEREIALSEACALPCRMQPFAYRGGVVDMC